MDLVAALARARSAEQPGPDTPAGPAVRAWPGPPRPLPEAGRGELDLRALLRLSLAASDRSGRLRPAASAGALHPVDAQLVVGTGCPLPAGRYGYDPLRHRVHRLGPEGNGTLPGVRVELSVTPQRTVAHYGHRAWPLILLDAGHAVGALWLAAGALGIAEPVLRVAGVAEEPLAVVHFAPPQGADGGARDEEAGRRSSAAPTGPASQREVEGRGSSRQGDGRTSRHAGQGQASRSSADGWASRSTADGWAPRSEPLVPGELPVRRSSTPPLRGTPPRDLVRAVLATAVEAGAGGLSWCVAVGEPEPELVEAASDGALRRLAAGEARPTLAAWAAGQGWVAEAGAVLLGYGCPADAGAPQIRRAHLRAGFAVQLAQVAAVRHGLAARPLGSWQQADLGAALGSAPGKDWIVHALALGTTHRDEEGTS
ncbi:SagB/ThcOx family dehydrogenase [Streptomyces sp. TRM68367]|uniref:nitroreductase family protein n=1 Tax=Streptomyces sp. TRM68367 TaxID=2758415 RepID=UPI0029345CE6|nr:SagB/ThcOx family dehydrogenase [Streptomyces sp. TRM68367]